MGHLHPHTGECWTFLNHEIRQEKNLTFGLPAPTPIYTPPKTNGHNGNGATMRTQVNGNHTPI